MVYLSRLDNIGALIWIHSIEMQSIKLISEMKLNLYAIAFNFIQQKTAHAGNFNYTSAYAGVINFH